MQDCIDHCFDQYFSEKKYQTALWLVKNKNHQFTKGTRSLRKAQCYAKLQKQRLVYHEMVKLVRQGYTKEILFLSIDLDSFSRTKYMKAFEKKYPENRKLYYRNMAQMDLFLEVEKLLTMDQLCRNYDTIRAEQSLFFDSLILDRIIHLYTEVINNKHIDLVTQSNFFTLVWHTRGDTNAFKKLEPLLTNSIKQGNLHGYIMAVLTDYYLVATGQKQLFGTAYFYHDDGTIALNPLSNIETVDRLRFRAGLSTTLKEESEAQPDLPTKLPVGYKEYKNANCNCSLFIK